ncbi:TIGR04222 domain-containing membrane protein [Nonomuraea gerenzanensis]|uniref:RGD1559993 (Predicted) n=1 Tax=Nonomuraea gerenzanensis TaxID=93944 RepID=A0A1M4EEM5_9ACTN|nr:TIGR04222 domain-containing membrane protein [Nonomuraea gerenzanensis]UBU08960.1 TIGR04222 domain-containing membrane protein [Nonomuraea gerenzanensis]SBO97339.1 RGD1559993 (predicted) [Nonomuraea gerenzanensis]
MDVALLLLSGLVALFTAITVHDLRRERRTRDDRVPAREGPALTAYELACLAGGPGRVAEVAVALLAGSGTIRLSLGGHAHRGLSPPAGDRHAVERTVLAVVRGRRGAYLYEIKRELRHSAAMAGLEDVLTRLGLLVPLGPGFVGDLLLWLRRLRTAGLACAMLEVVAMFVQRSYWVPVIGLVVLTFTRVAAQSELRWWGGGASRVSTAWARQELERARAAHPRGGLSGDLAASVALYGLSELRDPLMLAAIYRLDPGQGG